MLNLEAEAEAIARAKRGDANAFAPLVSAHQEAAFRTAWLILRDRQVAEDMAQEAFVRAFRELRRFRDGDPFRPWLIRIVRNLALNEVRSRHRRGALAERLAAVSASEADQGPAPGVESASWAESVQQAISELPLEDREVLYLRYFIDLSEREIAAAIGRPQGTVKSRLHRASRRLREVIQTKYPYLRDELND